MKKSNVFIQRELCSCGACCIQSIVSFYDGYVPLEVVIEDTKTTKNGTNAYNLVQALSKYGFNSFGMSISLNNITNDMCPLIAHVIRDNLEHFLVIYEINDKSVVVMDPAIGKKTYKKEEFNSIFDDIIIQCIPNSKIISIKKKNIIKRELYNQIIINKVDIIKLIITSVFILLLSVIIGLYVKLVSISNFIIYITLILSFMTIIKYILNYKYEIKLKKVALQIIHNINDIIITHIYKLPLRYLLNKRVGELLNRINDAELITSFTIKVIVKTFTELLSLISILTVLCLISFKVFILIVVSFIIYIIITVLTSNKLYIKEIESVNSYNLYNGDLGECLQGIESIKNLGKEDMFVNKISKSFSNYIKNLQNVFKFNEGINCFKNCMLDLFYLLIIYLCIMSVNEYFTLYDCITVASLYSLSFSSISTLVSLIPSYLHVKAIYKTVNEFMDLDADIESEQVLDEFKYLEIRNLKYTYDYYKKVLDIDYMRINKGDKILLRGNSGIGKSTFAKCISQVFKDYDGEITINGVDIKDVSIHKKHQIVYISQSEKLFSDTIKNNIVLDSTNANDLNQVLKVTMLEEVINKKRYKENSLLLDGGENYSLGERARIILARALFLKPDVLIIDETLSSVDSQIEDEIIKELLGMKELTLLYITHRNKEQFFDKIMDFRKDGSYVFK